MKPLLLLQATTCSAALYKPLRHAARCAWEPSHRESRRMLYLDEVRDRRMRRCGVEARCLCLLLPDTRRFLPK